MSHAMSVQDLSVLLVEPSEMQQKVISRALVETGVGRIEVAKSKSEVLDGLEKYHPDLIISSMYYEDGSADELLTEIRKNPETEGQAFMLVSSERNKQYLEMFRQSGVLAILPKPFAGEDLIRALKATVDLIQEEEVELELFDVRLLRVLVVDDSRLARKHISRVFQGMGVELISEAENGRQALERLSEETFDLLVTDYNMPEMDGRELTETVRMSPELAHIPVMMVSSEANESHLANIAQAGVDAICNKPFEPSTVKELLTRILS